MNFLRGAVSGVSGDLSSGGQPAKLNNFPICCPFLYHNIVGECGNRIYLAIMNVIAFFVFMALLIINLAGAIAAIAVDGVGSWLGLLVMSICYIIFTPPAAFVCQYWVGYSACAHSSSIRYVLFFFSYFCGIIFSLLMMVGVPNAGGAGLISAINLVARDSNQCPGCMGVGIFFFIMMVVWIIYALYQGIMILLMIRHFRQDNGSLSSIKDSITGFFARKGVENAVGI